VFLDALTRLAVALATPQEPRPNLQAGHVPGSLSVPSGLVKRDELLLPPEELTAALSRAHVDTDKVCVVVACVVSASLSRCVVGPL
jgi:thiosulfate/3-mercaptopyruvate sulfurtransferase